MTSGIVSPRKKPGAESRRLSPEQAAAAAMVAEARQRGLELTGPDGLLKLFTKNVLETALNEELTEHLGHEKNAPAGNEPGNNRNGTRPKAGADREHGDVQLEVPRRRDGNFKIAGTPGVVVARVVKTPGTGIANRDTLRQRDWESGGEPGLGRRAERR